jgi:RimJ/RimL family protein N-acetyltransferase
MLLFGHDTTLTRWAGDRLGISDFGPSVAIGVLRRGDLAAVAVFHHYRWPDIEISFVTCDKYWATPQTVRGILRYPFIQAGCKRLTAITTSKNLPTRAFLCRLGFREEGHHPDVFADGDAVSYGLLRKDAARWIAEDTCHGQEHTTSAASA